jgi:3-dehydroquinate dehydratase
LSGSTIALDELISRFLVVQKENLFVVQEVKKTGEVPETHEEYIHYLEQAVESLTNLGYLDIEVEE